MEYILVLLLFHGIYYCACAAHGIHSCSSFAVPWNTFLFLFFCCLWYTFFFLLFFAVPWNTFWFLFFCGSWNTFLFFFAVPCEYILVLQRQCSRHRVLAPWIVPHHKSPPHHKFPPPQIPVAFALSPVWLQLTLRYLLNGHYQAASCEWFCNLNPSSFVRPYPLLLSDLLNSAFFTKWCRQPHAQPSCSSWAWNKLGINVTRPRCSCEHLL